MTPSPPMDLTTICYIASFETYRDKMVTASRLGFEKNEGKENFQADWVSGPFKSETKNKTVKYRKCLCHLLLQHRPVSIQLLTTKDKKYFLNARKRRQKEAVSFISQRKCTGLS